MIDLVILDVCKFNRHRGFQISYLPWLWQNWRYHQRISARYCDSPPGVIGRLSSSYVSGDDHNLMILYSIPVNRIVCHRTLEIRCKHFNSFWIFNFFFFFTIENPSGFYKHTPYDTTTIFGKGWTCTHFWIV